MNLRISGGEYKGQRLRSSDGPDLRPTSERVRLAIFSILGQSALDQARVLDLYAGTGALGIEALSRGAAWADFVESDGRRSRNIGVNLKDLGLADRARVYRSRVERALNIVSGRYDLVFADPPYGAEPWEWLLGRLEEKGLLNEDAVLVAEHSPRSELAERYGGLGQASHHRYGDTVVSVYTVKAVHG